MIDPGIKYESGYSIFDSGTQGDHWIRLNDHSKKPAIGKVWPGKTVFPNFLSEKTRNWWADLFQEYMANGIDGVWNDMNEIASFQDGTTIPPESYHIADDELGGPDTDVRYHNVYGMMMTKATLSGIQKANPNKRPFVLTRANFMGGQRNAACWTGDNTSSWKHLHFSIPMALNMSLSGQVRILYSFFFFFFVFIFINSHLLDVILADFLIMQHLNYMLVGLGLVHYYLLLEDIHVMERKTMNP